MTREEYLKKCNESDSVTFIIAKAVKDDNTPYYHNEFKTTPIRSVWEWLTYPQKDYIVVNADHPPIDITGTWVNWYNKKQLKCIMITTEQDLLMLYGEKQAKEMIEWYKKKIK